MAATSLFLTCFLIRGHSSLTPSEDDIEPLLRRNDDSDDSEIARDRDFGGGDRDA